MGVAAKYVPVKDFKKMAKAVDLHGIQASLDEAMENSIGIATQGAV